MNLSEARQVARKIKTIFARYKSKFEEQKYKEERLTCYEETVGFTEDNRKGCKPFCNVFGNFMEEVLTTYSITRLIRKGIVMREYGIEMCACKSRHDTMKGSLAYVEMKPMLEKAILVNENFCLFVITDKYNRSRNIPLHQGYGLSEIQHIKGYDPKRHRWISDEEIYNHVFPGYGMAIKGYILKKLSTLELF